MNKLSTTIKLYLIPTTLGENALATLPQMVIEQIHRLDLFIVEKAKTARRFIKSTQPPRSISELTVLEMDKHRPEMDDALFREALSHGRDIGLLSEAGCPGVADPGARFVKMAHQKDIEVIPLVGPSSILLALMASGMNGQSFAFQGYLPPKAPDLAKALKRLEQLAQKHRQTQLFIETPYRNRALIEQALKVLSPQTRFCIAADLTLSSQYVQTKSVEQWRKTKIPDLHKRPALFLIDAG